MNKVILLDYGMFMFRAVFSSIHSQMKPTYTAMAMILSSLKKIGVDPEDQVLVACDGQNNWRKQIDPNYKANRKEQREKYDVDWDRIWMEFDNLLEELDSATDWHILKDNLLEADDWMAGGAKYFKDREVIVVSFDADLEQTWNYSNVKIYSPLIKYKGTKGAYKIKPPEFNVYKLIASKIEKEKTDNLISPILTQEDYETREKLINLLTLPDFVEKIIVDKLSSLPSKELNLNYLSSPSIRKRFEEIYNGNNKIIYKEVSEYLEKKKNKKKELKNGSKRKSIKNT
jgi:hypothetical protein